MAPKMVEKPRGRVLANQHQRVVHGQVRGAGGQQDSQSDQG